MYIYVTSIMASCYYGLEFCIMLSLYFTDSMQDLLVMRKLSHSGIICCISNLASFLGKYEMILLLILFLRRLDGNRITWIADNAFSGLKAMQSL